MNRRLQNRIFLLLSWGAVTVCGLTLVFLLGMILLKGMNAITLEFLFSASRDFGAKGGIFYQMLGTALLITVAGFLCLPVALGTALFQSEYLKTTFARNLLKLLIYGLNGIPSIIFGIFGLIVFVNVLGTGISWFVGALILGMMILPTVTFSTFQAISSIPQIYRETASALGLNQWQTVMTVLLPQGIHGAVTGLFLGLARAAGETAPIMLIATAFSGVEVPQSLFEPVTALPTHILALSQQATNPDALRNAWGASLVLLLLVLALSGAALSCRITFKMKSPR